MGDFKATMERENADLLASMTALAHRVERRSKFLPLGVKAELFAALNGIFSEIAVNLEQKEMV